MKRFEEALGGIALPYWDWTKEGEPHEITDATYVDTSGATRDNPLSYGIKPDGQRTKVSTHWSLSTDSLSRAVSFSQSRTGFEDHSFAVESPHNTVHVVRSFQHSQISLEIMLTLGAIIAATRRRHGRCRVCCFCSNLLVSP